MKIVDELDPITNSSPRYVIRMIRGPNSMSGGTGMYRLKVPFSPTESPVRNSPFIETWRFLLGSTLPEPSVSIPSISSSSFRSTSPGGVVRTTCEV